MPALRQTQYFDLDWNFGLGGGVGVPTGGGTPGVAVAGIAGLEFNFTKIPFDRRRSNIGRRSGCCPASASG